jgi:hypothetical protein
MGRGRAKAKQTKVARELKYNTGNLDPTALQRELTSSPTSRSSPVSTVVDADEPDYSDPYADQFDDDEDDGPKAAAR